MLALPVWGWLSNYTALQDIDRQALEYLQGLNDAHIDVQMSATAAPWIYKFYTDDHISFERVYDFSSLSEAQFYLFRSEHMTYGTMHRGLTLQQPLTLTILAGISELDLVKLFVGEDTLIGIFRIKAS